MKKKIALIMSVAVSVLMMTACSKDKSSSSDSDVLKIAIEAQSAPFCWTQNDDSNGAVKISGSDSYTNGFDIQMISKVCEEAGIEWEACKIDWDGMLLGVQTGTYDAAISGISITEKRKASMDFTEPYYYASVVTLVHKDSKYASAKTLSDFKGATTTSMMNTIWYDMCQQLPDAKIKPALDNVSALVVAVDSKAIDVVTCDEPTAISAMASNPNLVMIKPDESDTFKVKPEDVELGIAVAKGNEDIVKKFNDALAKITEEETLAMLEEAVKTQPISK